MTDLKVTYTNRNGERVTRAYNTVMDFTDLVESDSRMLGDTNVDFILFENPHNTGHFDTMEQLYSHLLDIMR